MPLVRGLNVSLLRPGIRDVCTLKLFLRRRRVPSRFSVSRTSRCCFYNGKHRYGWGIMFTHAGYCSFFSFLRILLSRSDTPCCLDGENLFLINLSGNVSFPCERKIPAHHVGSLSISINVWCLISLSSDTRPYRPFETTRCVFAYCQTVVSLRLAIGWDIFSPLFLIDSVERCAAS